MKSVEVMEVKGVVCEECGHFTPIRVEARSHHNYVNEKKGGKSRKNKRWTSDEEKTLIELYEKRISCREIGKVLGRSANAVANHFFELKKQSSKVRGIPVFGR